MHWPLVMLISGSMSISSYFPSPSSVHEEPNTARYQVVSTFSNVGKTPHFTGVDSKLHKVFVSNLAAGTVTVLDTSSGKNIQTINLGGTLHTVMVDQDNDRVYVTDIQNNYLDQVLFCV